MININGKSFFGNNIVVNNGKVIIDGKDVTPDSKVINIQVDGNVDMLQVDNCDKMEINGDANSAKTTNGNISISGSVKGDVQTTNGNVVCGQVGGSVSTKNGNIKHL